MNARGDSWEMAAHLAGKHLAPLYHTGRRGLRARIPRATRRSGDVSRRRRYNQAKDLIDQWLKTFDTEEEAAKLGNTASGAFVKEVKLGMTPAEVEAVLGVPETKVDLGEKVLYKYKNMTVEFHDGKVTDVR